MSKNKAPDPIAFKEVDVVRKTIDWHYNEISKLYKDLMPHKTKRGFIGGTNLEKDVVFIMFMGEPFDVFMMKELLDRHDATVEKSHG
jgi:hypothetical protein